MTFLQFADKSVPYGVFVKDVAAEVAVLLQQFKDDPEYISQNKAFAIFGRANVERWRRQGKVTPMQTSGQTGIPYGRPATAPTDTTGLLH